MSPRTTWKSARYEARFDPPALLAVSMRGVLREGEIEQFMRVVEEAQEMMGAQDLLFDMRALDGMTHGARRELARVKGPKLRRVAIYGAGFALKTIIQMVYRAGRVLTPEFYRYEIGLFSAEGEARAWLNGTHKR